MRKYIVTGVLVWIPILITIFVLRIVLNLGDTVFLFIPQAFRPESLLGFKIPGLGLLLSFMIILLTGVLTANVLGKWVVSRWEAFLSQIPLVRSIYNGVKQSLQVIFSSGNAFQEVVLLEYPRKGSWSLGFVTNKQDKPVGPFDKPMVTLFVPTTPNPTSGFILVVPEDEVTPLDMSVDDAIKFVISIGSVSDFGRYVSQQDK